MWNQILKTETVTKQMLPSLLHRVNSASWQHLCLHFSVLFPEEVPEAQPSWLVQIYVATNRGYMYLFWQCHQAFAVVPLIVMTLQKKKKKKKLPARRNECFTECVKFLLNKSAGPVSALLYAAAAVYTERWVSVTVKYVRSLLVCFFIDQVKWLSNPSYSEV